MLRWKKGYKLVMRGGRKEFMKGLGEEVIVDKGERGVGRGCGERGGEVVD